MLLSSAGQSSPHAKMHPSAWAPMRRVLLSSTRQQPRACLRQRCYSLAAGPPPTTELLYGLHPCAAALHAGSRVIVRAIISRSAEVDGGAPVAAFLAALRAQRHPIVVTDKQAVNNMVGQAVSQGVVLEVKLCRAVPLDDAPRYTPAAPPPVLIALDEVVDPQNVGSILRSALLLGASGVVLSARNSAPLNATVCKTSSGALEYWLARRQLYSTESMPGLLQSAAAAGWRVIGTAMPPRRAPAALEGVGTQLVPTAHLAASVVPCIPSHELTRGSAPTILVLGSEGKGLRKNVRAACNLLTYIPTASPPQRVDDRTLGGDKYTVDSLNVGSAASVLLYQLVPLPP